jgi:hypothetical protein
MLQMKGNLEERVKALQDFLIYRIHQRIRCKLLTSEVVDANLQNRIILFTPMRLQFSESRIISLQVSPKLSSLCPSLLGIFAELVFFSSSFAGRF